jgi:hypothetical protein
MPSPFGFNLSYKLGFDFLDRYTQVFLPVTYTTLAFFTPAKMHRIELGTFNYSLITSATAQ